MAIKQGTVEACNYKNIQTKRGNSQIWSFKVDGEYYGCSFTKPERPDGIRLLAGDKVKFEFEENQYGKQVKMDTLKVKAITEPSEDKKQDSGPKRTFGGSKQTSGGRDDYWAKKEEFDKTVTQPLIMRQSANNIAATLVVAALEKDILPLPGKKADKWEAYMLCYNQVRNEVYSQLVEDYGKLGGPEVTQLLGLSNVEDEDAFDNDKGVEDLEELEKGSKEEPWEEEENEKWD
jgi:hypothetical protein